MRGNWTNLILHTSASIYSRKSRVSSSAAGKSIIEAFAIIFMEIFLALISLPLYIVSRVEISEGKSRFKIRRIITMTFLTVVLAIWAAKLILIVGLPAYFDNRQFFVTSDNKTAYQAEDQGYIVADIYNAEIDSLIPVPIIGNVSTTGSVGLSVTGSALANSKIVINIGMQGNNDIDEAGSIKSYIVDSGETGNWKLEIASENLNLQPGSYWLQAITYDLLANNKSQQSLSSYFEIEQGRYEKVISVVDKYLNYLMIAIIGLGIFSIIMLI